jgi:hypothetical protein
MGEWTYRPTFSWPRHYLDSSNCNFSFHLDASAVGRRDVHPICLAQGPYFAAIGQGRASCSYGRKKVRIVVFVFNFFLDCWRPGVNARCRRSSSQRHVELPLLITAEHRSESNYFWGLKKHFYSILQCRELWNAKGYGEIAVREAQLVSVCDVQHITELQGAMLT